MYYYFERKSIQPYSLSLSALLGLILLFPLQLFGAEQSDPPEPYVVPQTQKSDRYDSVEKPRNYLSGKITRCASDIDRFFGGDRHYQESNQTVIQLNLTGGAGYGNDRNYDLGAPLVIAQ